MSGDNDRFDFYLAFDGIESRVGTQSFPNIPSFLGLADLDGKSIGGLTRRMMRDKHYIDDGGCSFRVFDSTETRALFARKGGNDTTLATAVSASATTIVLGSGAAAPGGNGSEVYIGRETITLGTHTGSGTYTGCTRGVFGSSGAAHDEGAKISDVPLFWLTRRVTLYMVDNDDDTETAIWFGALSASPRVVNGAFSLECVGRTHDLFKRPLCTGFRDVKIESAEVSAAGSLILNFANAADEYEFAVGGYGGFIRIEGGGQIAIFLMDSLALDSTGISLSPGQARSPQVLPSDPRKLAQGVTYGFLPAIVGAGDIVVRQIDRVDGRLGHQALKAMLSNTGNGAVHSAYDILPGRAANISGASSSYLRRRMGAGLTTDEVDVDSWQQCLGGIDSDLTWLDEEIELGKFLVHLLWRTGGYAYTDATGALAWKAFLPYTIRGAITAYDAETDFERGELSTVDDEDAAPGHARIEANYSPFDRKYGRRFEVLWNDTAPIYGDRSAAIAYESKGLWVGGEGGSQYSDVESFLERVRARADVAGRRVRYSIPWTLALTLVPGARFSFSDTRLHDLEGGLGVSGRVVEVVEWRVDPGVGGVSIEAEEVPRGWLITPAARVASWSSPTLTLSTTGVLGSLAEDANPGSDFVLSTPIRIYDASATPPYSTSTTLTLVGRAGTTLTTSGTPSFTPAAGDLVVQEDDSDSTGAARNDVRADVQDFAFGGDSNYLVGTGQAWERAAPRWT